MTEKLQIYKCRVCGNIVQVLEEAAGILVCCGEDMELQTIQYDTSELGEKHSPKRKEDDGKKYVHVKTHPMTSEHYIQFIQAYDYEKRELITKFFESEELPELDISNLSDNLRLTEYCNIHNLWGENK